MVKDYTIILHIYTPTGVPIPNINLLHFAVSNKNNNFPADRLNMPPQLDSMGENNTCTAFKSCWVKTRDILCCDAKFKSANYKIERQFSGILVSM